MDILKRPLITEKATSMHDKGVYTFIVDRKSTKPEIRAAIESLYGVKVEAVNTSTYYGKLKTRHTKAGVMIGRKPSYKKAMVTVKEGEFIDLYENL